MGSGRPGSRGALWTAIAGSDISIDTSGRNGAESIKEGGRSASTGRGKVYARHIFVSVQVAAGFILLAGGGLLLRSYQRLAYVNTGFQTDGLIAAGLPLEMERNPDPARLTLYVNQLLEQVRATPPVQEAAVATALPFSGWGDGMTFRTADSREKRMSAGFKIVTPGYFTALRLQLLAGRVFDCAIRPTPRPPRRASGSDLRFAGGIAHRWL